MTPCYCGTLGGLSVLVGSLPSPSPGRMLEPSCFGRCCALRLGCRPVPSSHFQDSVSCLTCSHDSLLLRHPALDLGGFSLSSSLSVATDPLLLRYAGWSLSWLVHYLHPSTDACFVLPDLTLDLTVLQYSSWVLAGASTPVVCLYCVCVSVPF